MTIHASLDTAQQDLSIDVSITMDMNDEPSKIPI